MSMMAKHSLSRHRLTAADYHLMGEAGILRPDARVELIEGEIIDMAPIGSRHAAMVERLAASLRIAVADRVMVRTQQPISLDEYSEPEPDISLVVRRDDYYQDFHPRPHDVLLVVEVAETSLAYDRDAKVPLYARSGIPETWIVDLNARRITQFFRPCNDTYSESRTSGAGESVEIFAMPDVSIAFV